MDRNDIVKQQYIQDSIVLTDLYFDGVYSYSADSIVFTIVTIPYQYGEDGRVDYTLANLTVDFDLFKAEVVVQISSTEVCRLPFNTIRDIVLTNYVPTKVQTTSNTIVLTDQPLP